MTAERTDVSSAKEPARDGFHGEHVTTEVHGFAPRIALKIVVYHPQTTSKPPRKHPVSTLPSYR